MAERREYVGGAAASALVGAISNTAMSITVDNAANWPSGTVGPFFLVIDPGLSSEEKVKCSARTNNVITIITRGADSTTASSHSNGAVVQHVFTADDASALNRHATDNSHDDHSQYVHIGNPRTITAAHRYTTGLISGGNIYLDNDLDRSLVYRTDLGANRALIGLNNALAGNLNDLVIQNVNSGQRVRFFLGTSETLSLASGRVNMPALKVGTDLGADSLPTAANGFVSNVVNKNTVGIKMMAGQTADALTVTDSGDAIRFAANNVGQLRNTGGIFTGTGAIGATGNYLRLGDFTDPSTIYIQAWGAAASNVSLYMSSWGTADVVMGTKQRWRVEDANNGNVLASVDLQGQVGATAAETSLSVRMQQKLKRVYTGAADSGGPGYAVLRVPN